MSMLEHTVGNLQEALVAAMVEVDQLRNQMYLENGKLQREFRETIDVLLQSKGGQAAFSPNRVQLPQSNSSGFSSSETFSRLEYLEVAVKNLQDRRESAPIAMENMLQQTKAFLHDTDGEVRKIQLAVDDKMRLVDSKLAELTRTSASREARIQEMFEHARQQQQQIIDDVVGNLRRREVTAAEQRNSSIADIEARLSATTNIVQHLEKRMQIMEEGIAQVDCEQRDITSSVQMLRSSIINKSSIVLPSSGRTLSPTRNGPSSSGGPAAPQPSGSSTLLEEILRSVDIRVNQSLSNLSAVLPQQTPPPQSPKNNALSQSLEWRSTQNEVLSMRQDIGRCVAQLERMMEESQRLTSQQHNVLQNVQRVEQQMEAVKAMTDSDLRSEFTRMESLQKTFFSRQEQIIAAERHQLSTKISADVQKMHQKHAEELQKAEYRRLEDIRIAQAQLRDDFNKFVEQQRHDLQFAVETMETTHKTSLVTARDTLVQETTAANDDQRRQSSATLDEVRKTSFKTTEELKRVKKLVEDFTERSNEQNKYMQNRMQQVVDAEVNRFDKLAGDFTLRLQHQIDEEVSRVVSCQEDAIKHEVHQLSELYQREFKNIRDEVQSLRSSLQTITAPSAMLMTMDTRIDTIRKDIYDLHEAVSKVKDTEGRITAHVAGDFRSTVENVRSEMLRDIGTQLTRFDRALVELSKEQANRNADMDVLNEKMNLLQVNYVGGRTTPQHAYTTSTSLSGGPLLPQNRQPILAAAESGMWAAESRQHHRDSPLGRQRNTAVSSTRPGGLRLAPANELDTHNLRFAPPAPPQSRFESPDKSSTRDRFAGIPHYSTTPPSRHDDPLRGVFGDSRPSP